jgi:hypothetical protein
LKKKGKAASVRKGRYEEEHPVVSFRVPREDFDRVKREIEAEGESIGEFLRRAFDVEQSDLQVAYNRGLMAGHKAAKSKYAIYVNCISCCEPVAVVDEQLKETAQDNFRMNCSPQALHDGCPVPSGTYPEYCTVMKGERPPI